MTYIKYFALVLILLSGVSLAENRWVTDEFEVMMRTGKDNRERIVRQLKSGTAVEVLEEDRGAGYMRVRVSSGAEGWVLSRYLKPGPTAQLRLPELQAQLKKSETTRKGLQQSLNELKQEKASLGSELSAVQSGNSSLQEQLDRITTLSASTVQLDNDNRVLKQQLAETELRLEQLALENQQLSGRSNREWFLIGAGVLLGGLFLGLVIPRIRWRKKSSWSDF